MTTPLPLHAHAPAETLDAIVAAFAECPTASDDIVARKCGCNRSTVVRVRKAHGIKVRAFSTPAPEMVTFETYAAVALDVDDIAQARRLAREGWREMKSERFGKVILVRPEA